MKKNIWWKQSAWWSCGSLWRWSWWFWREIQNVLLPAPIVRGWRSRTQNCWSFFSPLPKTSFSWVQRMVWSSMINFWNNHKDILGIWHYYWSGCYQQCWSYRLRNHQIWRNAQVHNFQLGICPDFNIRTEADGSSSKGSNNSVTWDLALLTVIVFSLAFFLGADIVGTLYLIYM